jgi:HD-GYP domain-containing protein (c-di-GMP phosphodiesterase class II)
MRSTDNRPVATVAARRSDLDELVGESRESYSSRLAGRDRSATALGALAFLAIAGPLAVLTEPRASPGVVLLLLVGYALVSRVEFEIGNGSAVPTQLVFVPMLFLLQPGTVPIIVALALILGSLPDVWVKRMHPERLLVQVLNAWYTVGPAIVLLVVGSPEPSWSSWPIVLAALLAQFAVDMAATAVRGWVVFGIHPRELLRIMRWVYLVDVALTPVGVTIAIAGGSQHILALAGLPLAALLAVLGRERQRRISHALELGDAYRGTALLLGDVVEADDAYTGHHSRDVVKLVLAVGDELGLGSDERRNAEFAALLHDVGKLRIPAEIINKPCGLSADERALIETHTIEGERMLARVGGLLGDVGSIVRSCHEHYDGSGYPDGLVGGEIPLIARIITCCDAFDAMTTDRPYRSALSLDEAAEELRRNCGTQFDPDVVAALLHIVGVTASERSAPAQVAVEVA